MSHRTRQTKTLLRQDCTYTTTFGQNLHYEAQPGHWKAVDLGFRRDGESHVADRNSTVVRVAGARLEVTDRRTERGIIWVLPARPSVSGRSATFAWRGLEWGYAVTDLGVKLEADVAVQQGPQTYEFPYQLVRGGDALAVDEHGDLRGDGFYVPRAFALGADGETYEAGPWRLLPGRRAAFDFDDSALPQDAFPYVLDPTTSFVPSKPEDEGNVTKSGSSYPPSSCGGWSDSGATIGPERSVNAKGDLFSTTNGFMSWDTSSLPDNAAVTASTLKFYSSAKADSNGRSLTADWYSAWPIDCSDFSDTAQTSAISGIPLADIPIPNLDTIVGLSGAAGGVSRTGRTGLRTHISGGQPTAPNYLGIWQLGNASNMPSPQLNVDYSLPGGPPAIVSATDSPDPVVAGQTTTFTVAWSDSDPGDSVRALICKTNAVVAGSCSGGAWASGGFSSTSPSSASYTTSTADVGTKAYYAFACDQSNACSGSLSGTFTVTPPNSAPTNTSAADSPDPVTAGNSVNFTVGWTDPNAGDTVRAVICRTNAITSGSCSGGTWASGNLSATSPASASATTSSADVGTNTYYAFACDQAGACSSSRSGTFQVVGPNGAPVVTFNVTPGSGDRSTVFSANFNGTYDPNNDPISYRIDWGDGTVNNSQSATHRYQNAGTYTVTGRACDNFGVCSSQSQTVTVAFSNRAPSANLTVSPTRGDLDTIFSGTVTGSDPDGDSVSYEIDWGDGTKTSGPSGTHRYASPGEYTVTGMATDLYGARSEDGETIEVCAAIANGQCVQTPVPVPDPCRDHEIGCPDNPLYFDPPEPLRAALENVQAPYSSNGEVLALTANVQQVYAIDGHQCTDPRPREDCSQSDREKRFARRILELVTKGGNTEDGLGGTVPDLILLQEVKPEDSVNIARELRSLGLTFEVGHGRAPNDQPKPERIPNDQANVDERCNGHYEDRERRARCKRLTWVEGDTSILYNTTTLKPPVHKSHWDARYWLEDHVPCNSSGNSNNEFVAPADGVDDLNGDLAPDCKLKWARQYTASFNEVRLNDEGEPTKRVTNLRVAVASAHFVDFRNFRDDQNATHADVKRRHVLGLDRHLNTTYEEADVKIIGGDFNIHKCNNKDDDEPGDYPAPPTPPLPADGCLEWAWWDSLTAERDYTEAVFEARRDDEDDRLVPQYKDGCVDLADDGDGCETPRRRDKRIDFIFGSSPLTVPDASHDLSCGQVAPGPNDPRFPPHCGVTENPRRYSDHRLVWGLFSAPSLI